MRSIGRLAALGISLVLSLSFGGGALAKSGPGSTWSQFHGSWTRDGYDTKEARLTPNSVGGLTVGWTTSIGENVEGSPVVSGNRVFVAGWTGTLAALRASDGRLLWSRDVGGEMANSSPAVFGQTVIVAYGGDLAGQLAAYSVNKGARIWSADVDGGVLLSPPTVVGSTVYIASQQGTVFAFSAKTGQQRWTTVLTTNADAGIDGPLAVSTDGSRIFAASLDGYLYALRASTGEILWTTKVGGGVYRGGPAYSAGVVYVPSGQTQAEGSGFSIVAVRASDGTVLWSAEAGDDVHSTPAVGLGGVYIGAIDGSLHAIDAETGASLWVDELEHEIWSSPALAHGVLYVNTESTFVAIQASSGEILFSRSMGTGFALMSSPAVSSGHVFTGAEPEYVTSFGLP
jgi:eukaryotic-like serine/threonine-protein kinase